MSLSKIAGQSATAKKHSDTTTACSTGRSINADNYPRLHAILSEPLEGTGGAKPAKTNTTEVSAKPATSTLRRSGQKVKNTLKTSKPTSNASLYFGDVNQKRGEKITLSTLSQHLIANKIYTEEEFLEHATQNGENRGTQIYLALSTKDWDRKISQACDIARSFTPDTPYRERLEAYVPDRGMDTWKGDATYSEYMELFAHHGITRAILQRWFKTLFGDNGKKNTIYMWGRADAGKTTIIKLFDAFYLKWEIGRASAQNINSNFWLQDLYLKRLFHADEILATQINIDTLKLLLEGSDDLTTDIKYAKKVSVRGRPVLMATNDPIWINMSTAYEPIARRCEMVHMTAPWGKKAYFFQTKDKTILQYVLHRLYKFCFPDGYNVWKNDQEFIEAIEDVDIPGMRVEINEPFNYSVFMCFLFIHEIYQRQNA